MGEGHDTNTLLVGTAPATTTLVVVGTGGGMGTGTGGGVAGPTSTSPEFTGAAAPMAKSSGLSVLSLVVFGVASLIVL